MFYVKAKAEQNYPMSCVWKNLMGWICLLCEGIGEILSVYPGSYYIQYKSNVDLVDRDLLST